MSVEEKAWRKDESHLHSEIVSAKDKLSYHLGFLRQSDKYRHLSEAQLLEDQNLFEQTYGTLSPPLAVHTVAYAYGISLSPPLSVCVCGSVRVWPALLRRRAAGYMADSPLLDTHPCACNSCRNSSPLILLACACVRRCGGAGTSSAVERAAKLVAVDPFFHVQPEESKFDPTLELSLAGAVDLVGDAAELAQEAAKVRDIDSQKSPANESVPRSAVAQLQSAMLIWAFCTGCGQPRSQECKERNEVHTGEEKQDGEQGGDERAPGSQVQAAGSAAAHVERLPAARGGVEQLVGQEGQR